jgi:DNA-binding CsgD family transcriptional regulator
MAGRRRPTDGSVGGNRGAAPGAKIGDGARSSKRSARVYSGEIGPVANTAGFYERVACGPPGRDSTHHRAAGPKEMAWLNTAAYGLSSREREIVDLIVRGLPSKQIAASLYVTEDTVRKHLSNIFEKVGVRSRLALVKRLYLTTIFP